MNGTIKTEKNEDECVDAKTLAHKSSNNGPEKYSDSIMKDELHQVFGCPVDHI